MIFQALNHILKMLDRGFCQISTNDYPLHVERVSPTKVVIECIFTLFIRLYHCRWELITFVERFLIQNTRTITFLNVNSLGKHWRNTTNTLFILWNYTIFYILNNPHNAIININDLGLLCYAQCQYPYLNKKYF